MKLMIDTTAQTLVQDTGTEQHTIPLHSKAAFELLSQLWVQVGWSQKYSYTFSWMGRPIIQLPEDLVRVQEVIYQIKPDVIVETGVAHGGSLIFYASLCKALQKGRVIGVDIEIRPHNRAAIEQHILLRAARPRRMSSQRLDRGSSLAKPCWSYSTRCTLGSTCWMSFRRITRW
jgi:cephalosporin hydroxylase